MTPPTAIRDKALEIAALCLELDQLLEDNPDLNILLPWDWIEEPGDDIFEHLAYNIENQMLEIDDD